MEIKKECPKCGKTEFEKLSRSGLFGTGLGKESRYKCLECGAIIRA